MGDVVGPHGDNTKNLTCCKYGNFGDKNHRFTFLLSDEGCDSFPRHLDLALAPIKTNGEANKQWNIHQYDKLPYIVTCLAVF